MIEIKTERLTLKKLGAADKERLIDLIGNPSVSETLLNVPYPYTDEDAEYWLNRVKTSELQLNIFLNNVLIGGIGLTPAEDDSSELAYCQIRLLGHGYATEACFALLDYKANTSHKKFRAHVYKGNTASSKVLKKWGLAKLVRARLLVYLNKKIFRV